MSENGKSWSMDDIDRLLSRTQKSAKKDDSAVVENFARTMRLADSVPITAEDAEKASRIETIDNFMPENVEPAAEVTAKAERNEKTGDVVISSKTAKQRVADVLNGIDGIKPVRRENDDTQQMNIFDEPLLPKREHAMETDENRRRFLERMKVEEEEDSFDDTKVIERSGFVVKRGKMNTNEGLEEAPKIVDADDAKRELQFAEIISDDEDSWADGQIKFSGFENHEETPVKITEEEAEEKLKRNRREKINKFKLMGIAEAEDNNGETDKKAEKLFKSQDSLKKSDKEKSNNAGVEYTNFKDINRIRGTLQKLKSGSFIKMIAFSVITVAMLVLNIISFVSAKYDTRLFQFINIGLLVLCIAIGANTVNIGMGALLKKSPNLKSAVAFASFAAIVQNISIIFGGAITDYRSFVISGCAAVTFALNEYGEYLRHARTVDAFNFCTGKNRNKLFSVQEIENKNEKFEIGRNLLMDSPDIRYSCRAKFPSKLIGQCESDVSSDKLQSLLFPITVAGSVVCGVLSGIITKDFLTGVSAWAGAVCICVPAFGVGAIQLPMRWANKRLNKAGGLITGQKAIEEYSKANSIVLDSSELFDSASCQMHGFKDFRNVRVDDIMLYSAAMVVRSGGPLANVFDQVVSKRELLPEVHSFNYEDRMGISGWINGQKVIMGNRNMMKHHNFELGDEADEEKYTHDGRKVVYLAIANSLAAMLVVSYAPNKKLAPFIKRLGTDGVTILLRNNDSNITTDMINETFGVKFNNIRLINNTSGRIYKKYRGRIRETAKSGIIHDGSAFTFMRSFTMSYTLCGTFKVENLIQLINVIAGVVVAGVLASLKVLTLAGMWPLLVFQLGMTAAAIIVARLRGVF